MKPTTSPLEDIEGSIEFCRMFLRSVLGDCAYGRDALNAVMEEAGPELGSRFDYLLDCGLARPALGALGQAGLAGRLPSAINERLEAAADRDQLRELFQKGALRHLDRLLTDTGTRGIVLKGGSSVLTGGPARRRATGDVDILVDEEIAPVFRRTLIDACFTGDMDALPTAPHHLAPVYFEGVPVEIHTRIMPAFWGLPERDMLAYAKPLSETGSLYALDAEGSLLHMGVHCTSHVFSHGLKTAWDLSYLLQNEISFDWKRLACWAASCRLPRGFWAPVRVICRELEISLPPEFLRHSPDDSRQQRLELMAAMRLFRTTEPAQELNPFTRNFVFLSLHDTWRDRLRYLAWLAGGDAARARRQARRHLPAQAARRLPGQFLRAWVQWRGLRAAGKRA